MYKVQGCTLNVMIATVQCTRYNVHYTLYIPQSPALKLGHNKNYDYLYTIHDYTMYTIQSPALKLGHNKNCAKETCNKTSCVGVLGTNTEQTGLPPGIPKENINLQVKVMYILDFFYKFGYITFQGSKIISKFTNSLIPCDFSLILN